LAAHQVRRSGADTIGVITLIQPTRAAGWFLLLIILLPPRPAIAEDRWFAQDKAKHFGAAAGIAAGGYAVSVPLTGKRRWRVVLGTGAGLGAGAAKELRDRRHGQPSWRDFTWSAAGTATGVLVAWIVNKALD
jgi:uncharacterized protein YfiM (DUF2279 family)